MTGQLRLEEDTDDKLNIVLDPVSQSESGMYEHMIISGGKWLDSSSISLELPGKQPPIPRIEIQAL